MALPYPLEVWRHLLESIAEAMGSTLETTAYSPNIKERRDYSCALFDAEGKVIAQAAHIPVHLGAMPEMMAALRERIRWRSGDMWICNDPATGGTHLPDLTLTAPVFHQGSLAGFVANRAHHADIGGMSPGSMPMSTELVQEGLILPPIRLVRAGRLDRELANLVAANSRTPSERLGDLAAQVAANRIGHERMVQLVGESGLSGFSQMNSAAERHTRALVQAVLTEALSGPFEFEDALEGDGLSAGRIPIRVSVAISEQKLTFDFTGTSLAVPGPVNATRAVTRAACLYVARCLVDEPISINSGLLDCVALVAPEGTVVNAPPGAAVSGGNVETSQRITDVLLGALAQAFPNKIPAASQGTMNNVLIGGWDAVRDRTFAYYETIAGGAGASAGHPGASALQVHMTNSRNTPIEELERHYPLRVKQYTVRSGSGGEGAFKGGDGVVREIESLDECTATVISERRETAPYGLAGGEPGAYGENCLHSDSGESASAPAKFTRKMKPGERLVIKTPGGGGFGKDEG